MILNFEDYVKKCNAVKSEDELFSVLLPVARKDGFDGKTDMITAYSKLFYNAWMRLHG